jgi:hypothetical protein
MVVHFSDVEISILHAPCFSGSFLFFLLLCDKKTPYRIRLITQVESLDHPAKDSAT